jgi:NAD(P)-dependent dehydrogenase (short-subunit alcohol dehydrogenase family)
MAVPSMASFDRFLERFTHDVTLPDINQSEYPTMSISSVQNKVVIVTGCSSGIGLATARLFLERKALVFGIDVGTKPQKLADEHETFTFHQANLTENRAVDEAISRCHQQHGRVDVLVNCAGVSDGWSSADTIHEDEWERVMAINLTVPIRLMKAVLPFMKEQKGGSIINVASKAGVSGASAGIAYTASKHGLVCILPFDSQVQGLRRDRLEQQKMLHGASTRMAFGAMECFLEALRRISRLLFKWTNLTPQASMPSCESSYSPLHVPANNYSPVVQLHVSKDSEGTPVPVIGVDDVARGIAFLASDEAKMINGAMIPIDNAWSTI